MGALFPAGLHHREPLFRPVQRSRFSAAAYIGLMVVMLIGLSACTSIHGGPLPPVMAQEELGRPYTKVGVVSVSRVRLGSMSDLTSEDYGWAHQALAEEAGKIGADAVILPEVKVEASSYLYIPVSDIKARGVAIRFH